MLHYTFYKYVILYCVHYGYYNVFGKKNISERTAAVCFHKSNENKRLWNRALFGRTIWFPIRVLGLFFPASDEASLFRRASGSRVMRCKADSTTSCFKFSYTQTRVPLYNTHAVINAYISKRIWDSKRIRIYDFIVVECVSILSSFRRIGSGVFVNITVHSCYDDCAHVFVIRLERIPFVPLTVSIHRINTNILVRPCSVPIWRACGGCVTRMLTFLTEFSKSDMGAAQK